MKDASDTVLSRVKYWHVANLGIILSKAGTTKAPICTPFLACHKLGFLMTWLRWISSQNKIVWKTHVSKIYLG